VPAVYLGVMTVAGAVGGLSSALTLAVGGLAGPIGELQVQVAASASIGAQFSAGLSAPDVTVGAMLSAAAEVTGTISAQLPTAFLQGSLDANGSLGIALNAKIAALEAAVDVDMVAALTTGGLYAFTYAGDVAQAWTSLAAATPPTLTGNVFGVVILAQTPEAQASLKLAFGIA